MFRASLIFFVLLAATFLFPSIFAHARSSGFSNENPLKLVALCESFNGNSYVAVWVRGENYFAEWTDDLDFGDTEVLVTPEAIKIETLLTWEPIVIPAGKNVVDIAGAGFNCDY